MLEYLQVTKIKKAIANRQWRGPGEGGGPGATLSWMGSLLSPEGRLLPGGSTKTGLTAKDC